MRARDDDALGLVGQVEAASRAAAHARDEAREAALSAIRHLEAALIAALAGESIRGLRNLGNGAVPFHAARVRGHPDNRILWPTAPSSEAETLCVTPDGRLSIATVMVGKSGQWVPQVYTRPAADTDLRAEDLDDYLRTLAQILPRHIAAATAGRKQYGNVRALADKVLRMLTGEESGDAE